MTPESFRMLRNAAAAAPYEKATWMSVIRELYVDFGQFMNLAIDVDNDIRLDVTASTFSLWLWSKDADNVSPVTTVWSAVMAGGPTIDADGQKAYTVSLTLFLFDALGNTRLQTRDGKSVIEFIYDWGESETGRWRCLGWFKDEYGEWEDVEYA